MKPEKMEKFKRSINKELKKFLNLNQAIHKTLFRRILANALLFSKKYSKTERNRRETEGNTSDTQPLESYNEDTYEEESSKSQ